MQKEIKQTWNFKQSPQEVWEYLTKPELLSQWLMETDFQPIVGHKFIFTCGKTTHCEVLEVKPCIKLSYSWNPGLGTDGKPFVSKVEWTLMPKENGTELLLVHSGFTPMADYNGHVEGWGVCRKKLEEILK